MPKVMLVSRCAWTLYNFRRGLMQALKEAGADVVCGGSDGDGYDQKILAMGVPFVPLPIDRRALNPAADLKLLLRLYRHYRQTRPDVVHHFTIKPVIYGSIAARAAGVPRIVNTVTGLGYVFSGEASWWLRRLVEQQYRVALGAAHYTFFQNAEDRQLFLDLKLTPEHRAGLVPGSGVDTDYFSPQVQTSSGSSVTFLMVARLLIDKGVYEYVEAARRVRETFPNACFQLLGPRDERNPRVVPNEDLERWTAEGVVKWLGEASDVREAMSNADVVVLPSYYREGIPRSLLEAASMGKPLITTDSVGCREAVSPNVSGILVPPRDVGALACAMERMTADADVRHRMGAAGRAKMISEFKERDVVASIVARYGPLLGAPAA